MFIRYLPISTIFLRKCVSIYAMFPIDNGLGRTKMARLTISRDSLLVGFTTREKRVLGRPDIKLQRNRIKSANVETEFKSRDLGTRVSRRSLFGGLLGEYRRDQSKIIVLGKPGQSGSFLKLSLSHPTIDEIWYFGADAEAVLDSLKK